MSEREELERLRREQGALSPREELEMLRKEQASIEFPIESRMPPKPIQEPEPIPAWKSALGGLSQSVSLGMGNRIISGAEALSDYLLSRGAHAYEGMPYEGPSLSQTYATKRGELEKKYEEAQRQNPKAYLGGSFAGGAATSFLPGASGLKASLAAGGMQGLGESKADWTVENIPQLAKDVGVGVGGSAAGLLLGKGVGKAVKMAGQKPVEKATTGLADFVFDLPQEVGAKIIKKPEIRNIEPKGNVELADLVSNKANELAEQLRQEGTQAWDSLREASKEWVDNLGPDYLAAPITKEKTSIRDGLKDLPIAVAIENKIFDSAQSAQKSARDKLIDVSSDLGKVKDWADLKTVIQNLDANIDWTNPEKSVSNEMLTQTRREIDALLKQASPQYAEIMGPIADKASQLANLQKRFALQKGAINYTPSDRSVSAAKNLVDNMSREVSPQLKQDLGPDLRDEFELANIYKRSRGDTGRGGRSVYWLGGTGAGINQLTGLDPITGGMIGAGLGMVRDKFGRKIASNLLSISSKPIKGLDKALASVDEVWQTLTEGQKRVLSEASQRGAQSFIVTWNLMNKGEE